jgi:hypothetical protein
LFRTAHELNELIVTLINFIKTTVEGKISHSNEAPTTTRGNNNTICGNRDTLLTIDADEISYSSTSATTPPAQ